MRPSPVPRSDALHGHGSTDSCHAVPFATRYPASHAFASALSGSDNIVSFHSKRYPSPLTVQGSGAGADVTAAGVVGDAIKVAERYGVRIPL